MAVTLPFDEFLALLRAKGFAVGLHEHMALAKLLARWEGTSGPQFADALAALVARNEDETASIRRLFDEVFAERTATSPIVDVTPQSSGRQGQLRRYVWAVAAVLAVAAIGLGAWRLATRPVAAPQTTQQQPVEPRPSSPTEPVTVPPPPPPPPPPPVRRIDWSVVVPPVAGLFLLALAGLWAQKARDARRRWLRRAWASTVELLPGPFHFSFVLRDPVARLPRIDIEDAATILGRAITNDLQTRTLDVKRTVRLTVRNGLMPTFVFRPRRTVQTILVIQDVSEDMRVWRSKVDLFLTDLRRQGIPLERHYFEGDIRRLSEAPHRATHVLDAVLRRRPNARVLVISNGSGLAATLSAEAVGEVRRPEGRWQGWRSALAQRERRSWLTPVSDSRLWPAELDALPVRVWPMTRRGLAQAARDLVGIDAPPHPRVREQILSVGRVSQDGIERVKRLAALVPYPSLELVELLRRQFAADVPDAVLLHLLQEGGRVGSPVIRLDDAELRRLQSAVRFETPKLEARVRRMLAGVLQESEPIAGSAAHERWQIAMAIHRSALASLGEGSSGETVATLEKLERGPLWEETHHLMSLGPGTRPLDRRPGRPAAKRVAVGPGASSGDDTARRLEEGLPSNEPPPGAEPMPWTWPGVRELAPAAFVVALLLAFAWQMRMLPVQALAHVPDAYLLRRVAPTTGYVLAVGINPRVNGNEAAIPTTVALYRDGAVFRNAVEVPRSGDPSNEIALEPRDLGAHFQVRAALPEGNLALSPPVWVPGEQVVVLIDAQPWARVTIEGDQAPPGVQTTPFSAALKPGTTYQLRLENGGLTPPLERSITVPAPGAQGDNVFRFTMPGFDPNETASQLSGAVRDRPAQAR